MYKFCYVTISSWVASGAFQLAKSVRLTIEMLVCIMGSPWLALHAFAQTWTFHLKLKSPAKTDHKKPNRDQP